MIYLKGYTNVSIVEDDDIRDIIMIFILSSRFLYVRDRDEDILKIPIKK